MFNVRVAQHLIFLSYRTSISPAFLGKDIQQPGTTAEITVYAIESSTTLILTELQKSLENQEDGPLFGTVILHVKHPGENEISLKFRSRSLHLKTSSMNLGFEPFYKLNEVASAFRKYKEISG